MFCVKNSFTHTYRQFSRTLALYLYPILESVDIVVLFPSLYFWFNAIRLTRSGFDSRKAYKNPTVFHPYIRCLMLCGRDVGLYGAFHAEKKKLRIAVCLLEASHCDTNDMLTWKNM